MATRDTLVDHISGARRVANSILTRAIAPLDVARIKDVGDVLITAGNWRRVRVARSTAGRKRLCRLDSLH